jgi:hypothetical protein
MKITGIIFTLFFVPAASALWSQTLTTPVTLRYQNQPLGYVLEEISRKYEVRFAYSSYYVPVHTPVSIQVTEVTLKQALDTLFAPTPIVYQVIGEQIALRVDPQKTIRLTSAEPLSGRSGAPAPNPLHERQRRERERLGASLPDIRRDSPPVLAGGDRVLDVDLEKMRASIARAWEEMNKSANTEKSVAEEKLRRTAQASLITGLGTNGERSEDITNNLSLNLLWSVNGGVDGIEIGGLVNVVTQDMRGAQFAGLGNRVGGEMKGAQFAGLFNVNDWYTEGFQFAGLFNYTRYADATQVAGLFNLNVRQAAGVQAAPLFNISGGRAGVQVAGLFNRSADATRTQVASLFNAAGDIEGAQLSLGFNKARHVEGFQIGLINVADSVGGASIGVLNFIRDGYNRFELGGGEMFHGHMGVKFGSRHFYNIAHLGGRWDRRAPSGQTGQALSWGLGYGLGTALRLDHDKLLNVEAVAIHVNENERWTRPLNLLSQLRVSVDMRMSGRASYFFGPTLNLLASKLRDVDTGEIGSSLPPYAWHDRTNGDTNVKMWVGFQGGMRF